MARYLTLKPVFSLFQKKKVTGDPTRQMDGAEEMSCSAYAGVAVDTM